ncbi:hypothetical protein CEP53_002751 [Fusarium sp. AF-6]|nr:hypothetical protein CEP53_002751 [Fusarium sp. AF-6]
MGDKHLPLQQRCGACGDSIFDGERVIALYGNDDSTACQETTQPFSFPQYDMFLSIPSGLELCRRAGCGQCAIAPEFVTVHHECYRIFIAYCKEASGLEKDEAVDRLWTLGSYRNPWPKAELIRLTERQVDLSALQRVADIVGLSQLGRLPSELALLVRNFSRHELFWRSVTVIGLSSNLPPPRPFSRILLNRVLSWKRGEPPIPNPSPQTPPFVRITMDNDGLCEIERLEKPPPYTGKIFKDLAFCVIRVATSQIYIEAKDKRFRLRLPKNMTGLATWNTDNPPMPSTLLNPLSLAPVQIEPWHLCALDLSRCSGVSFFFSFRKLAGVYTHRSGDPSAIDEYRRVCESRPRVVWVYMPIAPDDQVTVLGCRLTGRGFNMLVRLDLSGEVILGQMGKRVAQDSLIGYGAPLTLIYGEPVGQQPVPVLGARHGTLERDKFPAPFSIQDFRPDVDDAYFSWAPLDSIQSIRGFYDKDTGLCRGLIFQYENGGLRAVGECRKHLDDDVLVVKPSVICFQPAPNMASWRAPKAIGVRVELGNDIDHEHTCEGWKCMRLGNGVLTFSFTEDTSSISHRTQLP